MFSAILSKAPNLLLSYSKDGKRKPHLLEARPPSQPTTPRRLGVWSGEPLDQAQSHLFQLPAELRIAIYEYFFANPEYPTFLGKQARQRDEARVRKGHEQEQDISRVEDTGNIGSRKFQDTANINKSNNKYNDFNKEGITSQRAPPFPRASQLLDLLLTCRLIATEAGTLAFTLHTHELYTPHIHFMRTSASKLPSPLFASLRHLALRLDPSARFPHCPSSSATADFVLGAILLSPAITHVELRLYTPFTPASPFYASIGSSYGYFKLIGRTYVPRWFLDDVLGDVIEGRTYHWPQGQRWSITWPGLCKDSTSVITGNEDSKGGFDQAFTAVLVQEAGREVTVQLVFAYEAPKPKRVQEIYNDSGVVECVEPEEYYGPRDAAPSGMRYTPDEEYWAGLRRRKKGREIFQAGLVKMIWRK